MAEPKSFLAAEVFSGFQRPFYAAPSPFDPSQIYVCDFAAGVVRTVDNSFCLNSLRGPHSIDWDNEGFAYVAEFYGGQILKFKEGHAEELFLKNLPGPATAFFNREKSLLYVTDFNASSVSIYNLQGECVGALEADFNRPHATTFDADHFIYVADTHHHRLLKFDPKGKLMTSIGEGMLNQPVSLTIEGSFLYTSEYGSDTIKRFDLEGRFFDTVQSGLIHPYGVKISGGTLYVADSDRGCIQVLKEILE